MKYDLLLQNTASKQEFLVSGLTDSSDNFLSYLFADFQMPENAPEGEYQCVLFRNMRKDVQYRFNDVLLETVAVTGDGEIKVKYLRPEIFILKYGTSESPYAYRSEDKEYYYKKK